MDKDTSIDMMKTAYEALDEKQAENISVIKIGDISTIADYLIITNGKNSSQVKALQDATEEKLSKIGYNPIRVEGIRSVNWILMDYGDVIIHIMSKEDRDFYDLERIWRDGKYMSADEIKAIAE